MGEQENIVAVDTETVAEGEKHVEATDAEAGVDPASADIGDNGSGDGADGAEASETFEDGADGNGTVEKPGHRTAENAENARRRREREENDRMEKAKREARVEAILEALDGVNPYTQEPMKDASDVEIYETMKKMAAKGLDPVKDYPKYRAEQDRQAEAGRQAAREQADFFARDREAFMKAYPEIHLDSLIADADFADYAEGKVGKKPLAEIYAGYLKLSEKQGAKARESARAEVSAAEQRAAQALANAKATPGSAVGEGSAEPEYFTPEQVDKMTPAEIERNLDKIHKSMRRW
ncbi:MAG: hypothetical protein E7645_00880 [Ruminococcaceae bacterium]|nr:hypothetical protein [Oscillospiraceae bacterium]